jgi:hypothetical protein
MMTPAQSPVIVDEEADAHQWRSQNKTIASLGQRRDPVVLIAPAVACFDHEGSRGEVYASAHNAFVAAAERVFYYTPSLRLARRDADEADEDEDEDEDDESTSFDTRMLPLLGGYFKVSLMTEFDPPTVRRQAVAALRCALPLPELPLGEHSVRPLPVAEIGWRVADPLPLERLGISYYTNATVPPLASGSPFALEVVANNEVTARQLRRRFARLTLQARMAFSARVISHEAVAAASLPQKVMINTSHLLTSQAWRSFWGRAQDRRAAMAVKPEPGLCGVPWTDAAEDEAQFVSASLAHERTAFVAQLGGVARDFRREVVSRQVLHMEDGGPAAAKFEELIAKRLKSAARREVVWEMPAQASVKCLPEPRLVQGGTVSTRLFSSRAASRSMELRLTLLVFVFVSYHQSTCRRPGSRMTWVSSSGLSAPQPSLASGSLLWLPYAISSSPIAGTRPPPRSGATTTRRLGCELAGARGRRRSSKATCACGAACGSILPRRRQAGWCRSGSRSSRCPSAV